MHYTLEPAHRYNTTYCFYQHQAIDEDQVIKNAFSPVQRISHRDRQQERDRIQCNLHAGKPVRGTIQQEAAQARQAKRDNNIEDRFAQAGFDDESFQPPVVVHGIVLDVEHDAQYRYEHEIFDEKQYRDQRKRYWLRMRQPVKQNRVDGAKPRPAETDDERLDPANLTQVEMAQALVADPVIKIGCQREDKRQQILQQG